MVGVTANQPMRTLTAMNEIKPQAGAQWDFLASSADIAIIGGAAGCGKTFGIVAEPLRHINNAQFGSTIFRRSYPEITMQGGLLDESEKWYPLCGARLNQNNLAWNFPSGAEIQFRHLQNEQTLRDFHGAQIPLIEFDELQTFSAKMFFYMLSRNRSMSGVRGYVRGSCNPDPDSFLADFISWWIAEDGYADLSKSGKIRYFYRINDKIIWANTARELMDKFPKHAEMARPKSVTFIPGTIFQNKKLLAMDPEYLGNLLSMDHVDQERLLGDRERGGNWKIRHSAGKVFNRSWFNIELAAPVGGVDCRFWDFAATEKDLKSKKGKEPAFTAGVLIRYTRGRLIVMDVIEERVAVVDDLLVKTARADRERAFRDNARYKVRWEIEPGSSSKRETRRMVGLLAGYDAGGVYPDGDKIMRAKPFAAQAKAGNVDLMEAEWNDHYLRHMHSQPDNPFKDMMDASSGAANELMAENDGGVEQHNVYENSPYANEVEEEEWQGFPNQFSYSSVR